VTLDQQQREDNDEQAAVHSNLHRFDSIVIGCNLPSTLIVLQIRNKSRMTASKLASDVSAN
jgi:hypothetical protein